jgi:sortase (surface protein transpeptidase)
VGPVAGVVHSQQAKVPAPVALTIPAIGVQTSLTDLGLTAAGTLAVPPSTAVAGWYTGSSRPGALGPAVIAGHIDSHVGPGIFFHLSQLRPGDRVYVRRADGTLAVFRVTGVQSYAKDRFPTLAVYGPTPDAELRLITCGGTFDPRLRSYLSNTVVYAVQVSQGPGSG